MQPVLLRRLRLRLLLLGWVVRFLLLKGLRLRPLLLLLPEAEMWFALLKGLRLRLLRLPGAALQPDLPRRL